MPKNTEITAKLPVSRSDRVGYAMVMPYVLYFGLFVAFPLIFSFVLTFHQWNVYSPMKWVGLANFARLFHDSLFFKAVWNTFVFLLVNVPLQIAVALLLAILLNAHIKFRGFFRAIYFMPVIVSGVVITILWTELYSYENGLLNQILMKLGLGKVPWLNSPLWAMPSIAIMATWKNVGLYITLFLVGLQNIPKYLYEAADLDGASAVDKFFYIVIPSLKNTIILVVLLSTIGAFSLFIEPFVMTGGGPMSSTLSAMLYIYKQAFYFGHMGYAAALGFFFALIIFAVIIIERKVLERQD